MNACKSNSLGPATFVTVLLLSLSMAIADADLPVTKLKVLAQNAVSAQAVESEPAIKALRAAGQAGLDALFEVHSDLNDHHTRKSLIPGIMKNSPEWIRLKSAIDRVGAQRDCRASQLYWYTDFEEAKADSQNSGKPILSLRLLGNLDEEYSCANSRFFRTTLYANAEVSRYLRDHFVLHWQSVRPVPRITIDFGDGRKIERTITGNSIHYVLDSSGNPIDALPGLYGPAAFIAGLSNAVNAFSETVKLAEPESADRLREYHHRRLQAIQAQWRNDLVKVGRSRSFRPPTLLRATASVSRPTATEAAPRAVTKTVAEAPLLRELQPGMEGERGILVSQTDDATWRKIAELHAEDARLDQDSRRLVREKTIPAAEASRLALSKYRVEDPMIRMIQNLERSVAEDTVRNEYLLHSRIHDWYATGTAPTDLNALNSKAYAELFLTPDSDPWLGLAPADVFSALDHNGLVETSTSN